MRVKFLLFVFFMNLAASMAYADDEICHAYSDKWAFIGQFYFRPNHDIAVEMGPRHLPFMFEGSGASYSQLKQNYPDTTYTMAQTSPNVWTVCYTSTLHQWWHDADSDDPNLRSGFDVDRKMGQGTFFLQGSSCEQILHQGAEQVLNHLIDFANNASLTQKTAEIRPPHDQPR